MTIQEIIDYVYHTPHNTNKAILRQMLEQLVGENPCPEVTEVIYDGGIEGEQND